jgi:hypothetical protein
MLDISVIAFFNEGHHRVGLNAKHIDDCRKQYLDVVLLLQNQQLPVLKNKQQTSR